MTKKSVSKAPGELKGADEKQPSVMPSTGVEKTRNTSATLENSPNQKSQIGFQATQALGDLDKETTNARLVVTFAAELGALVTWKRLELADGQEVIALCFPLGVWEISPNGELVISKGGR